MASPHTHTASGANEQTPLLPSQPSRQSIDDLDFDARFKKWKAAVARKFRRSNAGRPNHPTLLITLFDGINRAKPVVEQNRKAREAKRLQETGHSNEATTMTKSEFQEQLAQVEAAIEQGIFPKMITTGSSGSYFVRIRASDSAASTEHGSRIKTITVAVFKPKDEEPYGNLNPKRQFWRKYFWWAMGRPCLIPNFSYLSEVGASYLDSRLALEMVPRTELVQLASPTFHYAYSDRKACETQNKPLPAKVGSYQTFLNGYMNASEFLRRNPWPSHSRSRTMMMQDFDEEREAHKVSRKKQKARLRKFGIVVKRILLCRPSLSDGIPSEQKPVQSDYPLPTIGQQPGQTAPLPLPSAIRLDSFTWTPRRMQQFRLELEKLVVLDFLMRNTDRGLDNFMIKHDAIKDEIKIGAIDNSLSFPIKHPNAIRQYPFGWLFLPSDLIGLPFSQATRQHFLPILNDPIWWQETIQGLRKIFEQDPFFDQAKFEKQISVLQGQAWNLVRCLESEEEGPLDLCAREKKLVRREIVQVAEEKLEELEGVPLPIDRQGQIRVDLLERLRNTANTDKHIGLPQSTPTSMARSVTSSPQVKTACDRSVGATPIGIRTSLSYQQTLIRASEAGYENSLVESDTNWLEGAYPRSLPNNTGDVDPFADQPTLPLQKGLDVSRSKRVGHHSRRPASQQPSILGMSVPVQSRREITDETIDQFLGRTGIEVLEDIDRERRKIGFGRLFSPVRKVSTTRSGLRSQEGDNSTHDEPYRITGSTAATLSPNKMDMTSSVVSDPGVDTLHQAMKSSSRRINSNSSNMTSSLHGTFYDDEILSEEDEDEDDEHNSHVETDTDSNSKKTTEMTSLLVSHPPPPPPRHLSYSDSKSRSEILRDPFVSGPSIDSVLEIANHSSTITPLRFPSSSSHLIKSIQTDSNPDNSQIPPSLTLKKTNKKILVIVEKLVSDTRQAWLKWI